MPRPRLLIFFTRYCILANSGEYDKIITYENWRRNIKKTHDIDNTMNILRGGVDRFLEMTPYFRAGCALG